jgi:hypothetical protein
LVLEKLLLGLISDFLEPSVGITNQMSIDELSPCEEEAPSSPAEDEHNQNGNLD